MLENVGFLNKSLAVMFLQELPEDEKTCAMYPATFHFKALVSEVSHIWNIRGYASHLRKNKSYLCTKPTAGEIKHISCTAPAPSTFLLFPNQEKSEARSSFQAWKRLMTDVYMGICVSRAMRDQYLSFSSSWVIMPLCKSEKPRD